MVNNINCFHCLIKKVNQQKGQEVRIICDWNDVIQDAISYPLWDIRRKCFNKEMINTYEEYFKNFWSEYQGDLYWRKDENLNELVNTYWSDPKYFDKVAFLSPAKELLLALKENLIEELIFLSSYSERVHPGGDTRKWKKFQATFGQFPHVRGLNLIPAGGQSKGSWIVENYPNFDIFIDDSPKKILSVRETFPNKFYVLPHYKCNEQAKDKNVYHVKTSVSDLSNKEFEKVAEKWKLRKEQEQTKESGVEQLQAKIELLPK